MKKLLLAASFAAMSVLALSPPAKAGVINDPALFEAMGLTNTCPGNCASVTLALDPGPGGKTTVMYTFNSTIPQVVPGDVKVQEFGSSTIGDVLRFENITSTTAALFLYSADIAGGFAADVGLPSSFQSNTFTISEDSTGKTSLYTPTSAQPGFCLTATGSACTNSVGYQLTSADARVPEPGTLALFGAGLIGLATLRRRLKANPNI